MKLKPSLASSLDLLQAGDDPIWLSAASPGVSCRDSVPIGRNCSSAHHLGQKAKEGDGDNAVV